MLTPSDIIPRVSARLCAALVASRPPVCGIGRLDRLRRFDHRGNPVKARITSESGETFHLWWEGGVVSDARSDLARRVVEYLNGELDLGVSRANPGGTDSHWIERGRLQTEDDFLLTVGSLVDKIEGILNVDLVGESDAIHEELLNNPEADEAISRQAVERAIARGLTREQAERLYG